mmetsp:Transcript_7349/g.8540  ORF Transcript_7349/g.8540 Transcript_7349/m.8540 type:complete len:242 (-) Transcript_7349:25-750(-)|eukprot:CAMPEP_0170787288 /NCGR_PEP_ID=MMETSP0733-20121128/18201_1 /TAXON_ID=186038 /ORGANISM="Fragilariopsis kerguelensis, Strain L26-C5" /LENGTH=241 /DNA_ID=CAMNT_0011133481 /DNA_START=151 /DNA_END=876 /DNA_ORIENTATION=+
MNSKATLYLSLFALTMKLSSSFSPSPVGAALTVKSFIPPFPSTSHRRGTTISRTTTCTYTKLLLVPEVTEAAVAVASTPGWDVDKVRLSVGFITIACAASPYALSLLFPSTTEDAFFLPMYVKGEAGRRAEIQWKNRYSTLGLALAALSFFEVMSGESDPSQVLKDSYILWAIFYTDAALKVRREATAKPKIFIGERVGVQAWHIFVAVALWADVSESYTGNAITNFIETIFGPLFAPLFN